MADEIARLYATIGMDATQLEQGAAKANAAVKGVNNAMSQLGAGLTQGLGMAGAMGIAGVTAKVVGMGVAAVQSGIAFNAMQEQSQVAFTTMLGSAGAAKDMLADLTTFAAKTPFELPTLTKNAQLLKAMGFAAEAVIPTLTTLGNAVSGMGKSPEYLDRLSQVFGKIQATGKVTGETIMQMSEAGIPAARYLAEALGTDVAGALAKVSTGAVDSKTALAAITIGMDKQFSGMMEKQSQTWNGLKSTIADYEKQIAGAVTQPIFDSLKHEMSDFANKTLPNWLKQIEDAKAAATKYTQDRAKINLAISIAEGPQAAIQTPAWITDLLEKMKTGMISQGETEMRVIGGAAPSIAGKMTEWQKQLDAARVSLASWREEQAKLGTAMGSMYLPGAITANIKRLSDEIEGLEGKLARLRAATNERGGAMGLFAYGIQMAGRLKSAIDDAAVSAGKLAVKVEPGFDFRLLGSDAARQAALQEAGIYGAHVGTTTSIAMGRRALGDDLGWTPSSKQDQADAEVAKRILADDKASAAATKFASAMDSAAASMASRISGYFSDAQAALKGLLPGFGFGGDITKPGSNGPFENIYRAAAVAQGGNQNEWASKLGINQDQAKKIVQDFGAGNMTADVQKMIDVPALVKAAQDAEAAKASQSAFMNNVAGLANVSVGSVYKAAGIANPAAEGAQAKTDFAAGFKGVGDSIIAQMQADLKAKAKDIEAAGTEFIITYAKGFSSNKGALVDFAQAIVGAVLKAMKDEGR